MSMQTFVFLVVCVFVIKSTFGQKNYTDATQLDSDNRSSNRVQLMLDSKVQEINQANNQTSVVTDGPYFIYPSYAKLFKKYKYFGGITNSTNETSMVVVQVQANDTDKSRASLIEYSIVNSSKWAEYFIIDPLSGSIKAVSPLSKMPTERPIILEVQAQDGPTTESDNLVTTQVIVNEILDEDQVTLVLCNLEPAEAAIHQSNIVSVIERTAYLIVAVENITAPTKKSSLSSLIWVSFVDPRNETVVPRNSTKLEDGLLSEDGLYNLTVALRKEISNISAVLISTLPNVCPSVQPSDRDTMSSGLQWSLFAIIIFIIAALIGVLGIAGIICICILWSRYKAHKEHFLKAYIMPKYDPVIFVEPNRKQYETQVLKMTVPVDDSDSGHDLQLDLSNKNHTYNLNNVSYITRDRHNAGSSSSSEESPAAHSSNRPFHNQRKLGRVNHSFQR